MYGINSGSPLSSPNQLGIGSVLDTPVPCKIWDCPLELAKAKAIKPKHMARWAQLLITLEGSDGLMVPLFTLDTGDLILKRVTKSQTLAGAMKPSEVAWRGVAWLPFITRNCFSSSPIRNTTRAVHKPKLIPSSHREYSSKPTNDLTAFQITAYNM
ncbi:2665_t:CDS:2 [Acaulospora colombiana]|uniref:2665_t:CDS:1 n=1 Tax=Acaulospora colombiana TaxID=27376 RepID=A0ACA9P1L9_9GLOM|nr:2665_t:CDS:2 [Acaulospora colombiana]